jgi:hypothetical protein
LAGKACGRGKKIRAGALLQSPPALSNFNYFFFAAFFGAAFFAAFFFVAIVVILPMFTL